MLSRIECFQREISIVLLLVDLKGLMNVVAERDECCCCCASMNVVVAPKQQENDKRRVLERIYIACSTVLKKYD